MNQLSMRPNTQTHAHIHNNGNSKQSVVAYPTNSNHTNTNSTTNHSETNHVSHARAHIPSHPQPSLMHNPYYYPAPVPAPAPITPPQVLKKYRIENESFRLWSHYKPSSKKLLGRGGYGVVMEALDTRTGEKVAIKKMKNVFAHLNTAKCSLRELTLLMHFDHPNIINVMDCMLPEHKNLTSYQQVYYVMPKMQSTLKTVCCYSDIEISVNHRCFILYQILNGCKYIHECDVIHRDIKPENILINSDCTIKITDFGMARGINTDPCTAEEEVILSEYVTTRWYRAPEIMLCSRQYSPQIDVWSIACIYCEMILRKPIFAGNNHLEQLELIFDCVGTPDIGDSKTWIKSYDALRWVLSLPIKKAKSFEKEVFVYPKSTKSKDINKNEIDLIAHMFVLNPHKRISVQQCLMHKFFKKIPNKIKSVKEVLEFKNIEKFDTENTFEKQLTKLSLCRLGMLNTLKELHQRDTVAIANQSQK